VRDNFVFGFNPYCTDHKTFLVIRLAASHVLKCIIHTSRLVKVRLLVLSYLEGKLVLRCEIPEFPNAGSVEKNTKSASILFHIYFIQHF